MQTHPGTLNELRRATFARADKREVPTVAFHWDQPQRRSGTGQVPDNEARTVYRIRVQASSAEAGLHTLGEVLTNGNLRGLPNRTLFVASMPGAVSWGAEVVAVTPGTTANELEPATFGFSECPVCIEPGISPLGGTLLEWDGDEGGVIASGILAPGVSIRIGAAFENRRIRRVFISQPGTGGRVRWYWQNAIATGQAPISLPAGVAFDLPAFDRLKHSLLAWDLEFDNGTGTGNLYYLVELAP